MEPDFVGPFRTWLEENGAYINPSITFVKDNFGTSVNASKDIPENSNLISCPFSLAITPSTAKRALEALAKSPSTTGTGCTASLGQMSERQLLCLYIVTHWILKECGELTDGVEYSKGFNHLPYLNALPPVSALRTPLHFSTPELELFRGTNLYGATLDRKKEWEIEWTAARQCIADLRPDWHNEFTWDRYLTASTYISSRAFPSTLLSSAPSLIATESSYPVLLPGVDSLNHTRGHPMSWVIESCPYKDSSETIPLQVTLVARSKTSERQEVFNNYGPKPNAEFILGYGFTIANNPDDTMVLKIGGASSSSQRWEIGRHAKGIQGLWEEMKGILRTMGDEEEDISDAEICLEAADMLEEMIQQKLQTLPVVSNHDEPPVGVRKEVFTMLEHYVEGQRDILNSVLRFCRTEQENTIDESDEE